MRLEIIGWNGEKGRWSGVTFFIDNVCIMCLMWEYVCVCVFSEKKFTFLFVCTKRRWLNEKNEVEGCWTELFFFSYIANETVHVSVCVFVCVFLSCMVCGVLGVGSLGRWIYRIKFVSIFFLFLYIVKLVYSNIHKMRRGWE